MSTPLTDHQRIELVETKSKLARAERDLAAKDAEIARSIRNNEALVVENEEQREQPQEHENPKNKCKACGYGLTYCGHQDPVTHVPAIDCPACDWMKKYQAAYAQLEEVKRDRDKKRSILGGIRDALFAAGFTDSQGDSRAEVQTLTTDRDSLRTALAEAEKARDAAIYSMTYFRYSHDEIEAACGGEVAMKVREKVIERRRDIEARSTTPAP